MRLHWQPPPPRLATSESIIPTTEFHKLFICCLELHLLRPGQKLLSFWMWLVVRSRDRATPNAVHALRRPQTPEPHLDGRSATSEDTKRAIICPNRMRVGGDRWARVSHSSPIKGYKGRKKWNPRQDPKYNFSTKNLSVSDEDDDDRSPRR